MNTEMSFPEYQEIFSQHAAAWGIRSFDSEETFFAWQRETLTRDQLLTLNQLLDQRKGGAQPQGDTAFYNFIARPSVFPTVYSERYHFYEAVGKIIADRLPSTGTVLDFGCGIGILTTLLARIFPNLEMIGVDMSSASIETGRRMTSQLGLSNIRLECLSDLASPVSQSGHAVISTHALFQSEFHPGLPSQSGQTFHRPQDSMLQQALEAETGLDVRLDWISEWGGEECEYIFVEKAHHVGRRILFQRALALRGFHLCETPEVVTYQSLGDWIIDGPAYVLKKASSPQPIVWPEEPVESPYHKVFACQGSSAAWVVSKFPQRIVSRVDTKEDHKGRTLVIEEGQFGAHFVFRYLQYDSRFHGLLVGIEDDDPLMTELLEGILSEVLPRASGIDDVAKLWPGGSLGDPTHTPVYENHTSGAQRIWKALPHRTIQDRKTVEQEHGRQQYIEMGVSENFAYLYWGNTFDQRQLVVVEMERANLITQYFQDSVDQM
jgi:SAM-dependent methyltransferase